MKHTNTKSISPRRRNRPSRLPILWAEVPHQELWQSVLDAMALGSPARSDEDSLSYILKRRLPRLDPTDHARYTEQECQKIVETLRVVRDRYRAYLEEEGCRPVAEMHWMVFRLAVVPYAVRILRETATAYVISSDVPSNSWQTLYCYSAGVSIPLSSEPIHTKPLGISREELVRDAIASLVQEDTFKAVRTGGPFGRDGQVLLGRQTQGFGITITDAIKLREELWGLCRPWTEGLATLFDAAQEEIFSQSAALPRDGRQAAARFVSLSDFEKISYIHLMNMRRNGKSRTFEKATWLALFRELDKRKVALDDALLGKAQQVLTTARQKGHQLLTWEECYASAVFVSLVDGKRYSLRREMTHALHNAAKKASHHMGKVWKV